MCGTNTYHINRPGPGSNHSEKVRLSFLFLMVLCACLGKAQQDVGGFFHFTLGVSLPEGDFASKAADNTGPGFAKTGMTANVLFGHKIHKEFGGFAMLMFSVHPIDNIALSASLNNNSNAYQWKAERAFWSVTGFTFGPQFSHNFKKSALDFRLGAGALNFISPELIIEGTEVNSGPTARITQKQSRASSWGFGGGVTYKYEVKWAWVILVNADYYAAKPEFIQVEQITEVEGQNPETSYSNFKQEFIMLQFGMGLGYVF